VKRRFFTLSRTLSAYLKRFLILPQIASFPLLADMLEAERAPLHQFVLLHCFRNILVLCRERTKSSKGSQLDPRILLA